MAREPQASRTVQLALVQMACAEDWQTNADTAERLVREAAAKGAGVVLLPELFAGHYFCKDRNPAHFEQAVIARKSPLLARMAALAAELDIVLPVSFFELDDSCRRPRYHNAIAMYDGAAYLGSYHKSHIPDGPGYWEKYYFAPGRQGFKIWDTSKGRIGLGICWDQWFPEAARIMCLMGAELLLYPTAIGSEPEEPQLHTRPHWQRVMQGHAGANLCYLGAANRVGLEKGAECAITFYGSSFIAGPYGEMLAEAAEEGEALVMAELNLGAVADLRKSWGFYRDRRPDLYELLLDPMLEPAPGCNPLP